MSSKTSRYMFRRDLRHYILEEVAVTRFLLHLYFKAAEEDKDAKYIEDEMEAYIKLDKTLSKWLLEMSS